MVERFGRIEEARGSTPLTSTSHAAKESDTRLIGGQAGRMRLHQPKQLVLLFWLVLILSACSSVASSVDYEGLVVEDPQPLPQLVLTDTNGNDFDLVADTEGDVKLLYFGFTHCPDICNIQLNQISQVLSRPGAPTNVKVLFVSVDPERDTLPVIRTYLNNFSSDFIGLLASDDQLIQLQNEVGALSALKLDKPDDEVVTPPHSHDGDETHTHDDVAHGDFQPGTVNYEVGHDARMFAFAPDTIGYTQYPHPTRQSQYANDLVLLADIGSTLRASTGA